MILVNKYDLWLNILWLNRKYDLIRLSFINRTMFDLVWVWIWLNVFDELNKLIIYLFIFLTKKWDFNDMTYQLGKKEIFEVFRACLDWLFTFD